MQLALSDGRAIRMIQALLAAADPLDRIERGAPASSYDPLAVAVLVALQQGADARRVVLLLNDHAVADPAHEALTLGPVVAFAQAVLDWWANAASRWTDPVAI
jgi:hypothetical protein